MENNELTHWGIKGMRWGIRRYQNKDGSLTPAGKKKLRAEQAKVREQEAINKKRKSVQASFDRLEARKKAASDEKKALDEAERIKLGKGKKGSGSDKRGTDADTQSAKKSYKDMTDAELNAAINRARMEEAYRQLHPEPVAKPSFMNKVLNEAVVPAAVNAGKQFLQNALTKAGENLLKGKADPNSLEALEKTAKTLDLHKRIAEAKQTIDKINNPDKYLSEEDKNKRQDREHKAEDRAARKEGYVDAADKAVKTREAAEAARKAKADEAARVANEAKSQEYYNSTYNNKGVGERTQTNATDIRGLAVYNSPVSNLSKTSPTVSKGTSSVNRHMNDDVYDLLDRNGNVIASFGDDD